MAINFPLSLINAPGKEGKCVRYLPSNPNAKHGLLTHVCGIWLEITITAFIWNLQNFTLFQLFLYETVNSATLSRSFLSFSEIITS